MSERTFTEDEISRILKRAAELEAERSLRSGDGTRAGLTLTELEHIAADTGIDPDLIRLAASETTGTSDSGQKQTSEVNGKVRTRGDEIATEFLIPGVLTNDITEELITEMNHRYGTSEDDISWWDDLWKSYAGKATIRKTKNSTEWRYTTESETYSIRALFQQRGDFIRVRISKRTLWGITWNHYTQGNWILLPLFLVGGGILGYNLIDSTWLGLGLGTIGFMLSYPFGKRLAAKFLEKHRNEVELLGVDLENLAYQIVKETPASRAQATDSQSANRTASAKAKTASTIDIEDLDEKASTTDSSGGRLRNQLR